MNVELFLETLPMMGLGMAGIFLVILIVMGVVIVLNKLTAKRN